MNIYCVKCKKNTDTNNITNRVSKNGKNMVQGSCSVCGTKKTRFVSAGQSGGMIDTSKLRTMELKPHEILRHNIGKPYRAFM